MTAITLRSAKGSDLDFTEADDNFSELDRRTKIGWRSTPMSLSTDGIPSAPPRRLYKSTIYMLAFAPDVLQECTLSVTVPLDYIAGTDVYGYARVVTPTASNGDVAFGFTITFANDFDLIGSPTVYQTFPAAAGGVLIIPFTADYQDVNLRIGGAPISIPYLQPGATLLFRAYRDALAVTDTYPDDVYLYAVDLIYQAQGFGPESL